MFHGRTASVTPDTISGPTAAVGPPPGSATTEAPDEWPDRHPVVTHGFRQRDTQAFAIPSGHNIKQLHNMYFL